MSAASSMVSIVSLGVSCQTAIQIRRYVLSLPAADQTFDELGKELILSKSSFPFDWRIQPVKSLIQMAETGTFFPETPNEMLARSGTYESGDPPPFWTRMNCFLWHDFKASEAHWEIDATFAATKEKYDHTIGKFLGLSSERLIFVVSNTQNNLVNMSGPDGRNFYLDTATITGLRAALDALFPDRLYELIVVTSEERSSPDRSEWPCALYVIDQADLGAADYHGDFAKWNGIFTDYFAKYPLKS